MGLLPRQKLYWLRYAVAKATAASQTLIVWLAARVITHGDSIVTGGYVNAASAGGSSTSQSQVGSDGVNPASLAGLWDELLELYDVCLAVLIADGDPTPTQAEVVAEMRFRLQPVESSTADFSDEWVGDSVVAPT